MNHVARSIGRLAALALVVALLPPASADSVSDLIAGISSDQADARIAAMQAAGPVGAPAVVPLGELAGSPSFFVAKAAQGALATIAAYAGRPGAESERAAVAAELTKLLDPKYPVATRREVLHQLSLTGGEPEVAAVAALLDDPELQDDARMALERIPGDASAEALAKAITLAPPEFRTRLFASLAHRNVQAAVPALIAEARGNDAGVAWAALDALSRLGVPPSQVFPRSPSFTPEQAQAYAFGFLRAAHARADGGDVQGAERLYASVASFPASRYQACAALEGLARTRSQKLIDHALGFLVEPGIRQVAVETLSTADIPQINGHLAKAYPLTAPGKRALILRILAAREAPELEQLLGEAQADASAEVRMTALLLQNQEVPAEVLEGVIARGMPWAREEAAGLLLALAGQRRAAGDADGARVLFESLARSRAPVAERAQALGAIEAIASPASLAAMAALREDPNLPPELTVPAGRAAVAACAAQPDAAAAVQQLLAIADSPAPEEVTSFAAEKLSEKGVKTEAMAQRKGFVTEWRVLGAFPNAGGAAFNTSFFDEAADPVPATVEADGTAYAWKPASADGVPAVVNLAGLLSPNENVAAYAYAEITVERAQPALFLIGSDDGCEFWVNGKKLHATDAPRGLRVDQDRVEAELVAGRNRILIKVLQGSVDWQFCVRITDRDGKPVDLSGLSAPAAPPK
ncbi:MAG: hypothetical protein JXR94_21275 [Candidatus Hydrogenedentes bacterium]|nr:hypothetical protein [Candidatus Hydrogenedentota bacterium]